MRRWERRLKDLALSLEASGSNYFEPELFRLNANHFLTTSRTVSFLFQKDKATIENFTDWHAKNIVAAWKDDEIMKWSIVARNTIEKEGDLDLHSSASATLIFGYLEEEDVPLDIEKNICLGASIKRLTRLARTQLPSWVSDSGVIKIERTWIANTLPNHELLQAFRYIYTRMHEACTSLAHHLKTELDRSIPDPTSFDETSTASRGVHYVKLNSTRVGAMSAKRIELDETFVAPEWLTTLKSELDATPPNSLETLIAKHAKMAEANFLNYGNHMAMVWLYDKDFKVIDYISTLPENQADKYIFWRNISERIHYLKASYLIWTAEAWIRTGVNKHMTTLIRNLPIKGEILQVSGIDGKGGSISMTWDIVRKNPESKPTLNIRNLDSDGDFQANYLTPAKRALEKVT